MKECSKVYSVIITCDVCGKKDEHGMSYECIGCHKDFCWDCHKNAGFLTHESINYSNHGFFFCNECIVHVPKEIKPLYHASLRVEALRKIREDSALEWRKLEDEANTTLNTLREAFIKKGGNQ